MELEMRFSPASKGLVSDAGPAVRVQVLQGSHVDFAALQRSDSLGGGPRSGERSDRGNAPRYRRPADGFLVEPGLEARGRVNDELNALALYKVHDVGTAFFHFIDALHVHAGGFDDVGGAGGRDQLEPHVNELTGDLSDVALVVVRHTQEYGSLDWQFLSGCQLRLGECLAKVVGHAHDFAS